MSQTRIEPHSCIFFKVASVISLAEPGARIAVRNSTLGVPGNGQIKKELRRRSLMACPDMTASALYYGALLSYGTQGQTQNQSNSR